MVNLNGNIEIKLTNGKTSTKSELITAVNNTDTNIHINKDIEKKTESNIKDYNISKSSTIENTKIENKTENVTVDNKVEDNKIEDTKNKSDTIKDINTNKTKIETTNIEEEFEPEKTKSETGTAIESQNEKKPQEQKVKKIFF